MVTRSLWEAMHTTQQNLEEVKVEFLEQLVIIYCFRLTSAPSPYVHEFVPTNKKIIILLRMLLHCDF
jgi:hypothetical protein